jgi:hypothetical protein
MVPNEDQAAVAAFIRFRGCPTACVVPTQGVIATADRAALEDLRQRARKFGAEELLLVCCGSIIRGHGAVAECGFA